MVDDTQTVNIKFDQNCSGNFPIRTRVSDAANALEKPILGACGGRGQCTGCLVEFKKAVANISPMGDRERQILSESGYETDGNIRLGCLVKVFADVDVRYVGDEEVDLVISKKSKDIRIKSEINTVVPSCIQGAYGVACDIGTTTISMHLCDLDTGNIMASASVMNPQTLYGADVLARISYIQNSPDELMKMSLLVRGAVNDLIANLCADINISGEKILDSVIVGNPTMIHFFKGDDPAHLGQTELPEDRIVERERNKLRTNLYSADDFGLNIGKSSLCYIFPEVEGHVGADAMAALLATGMHHSKKTSLLIDVGTNAEIFLGNRNSILASSTPAAPAFEGADISCGQRASKGAIEKVEISEETHVFRYKVIGESKWSDDPNFSKNINVTGICGSGIIDLIAQMFLRNLIDYRGAIIPQLHDESNARIYQEEGKRSYTLLLRDGERPIRLTQDDVSNFVFVKGAIRAAVEVLKKESGVDTIDKIYLAGGFGTHINVDNANMLGLFPEGNIELIGNAAGDGACMALMDENNRKTAESLSRKIQHVEVAENTAFQDIFMNATCIPYGNQKKGRRRTARVRLKNVV